MALKVLGISASPRREGNSELLLRRALAGAEGAALPSNACGSATTGSKAAASAMSARRPAIVPRGTIIEPSWTKCSERTG